MLPITGWLLHVFSSPWLTFPCDSVIAELVISLCIAHGELVCSPQWHPRLHGSRSSPEGHGVRQQRRLVLLRLHALQASPRVKAQAAPLILLLLLFSPRSPRTSRLTAAATEALKQLGVDLFESVPSPSVGSAFDLVCVWGCVCPSPPSRSEVCKCQRSEPSRSEFREKRKESVCACVREWHAFPLILCYACVRALCSQAGVYGRLRERLASDECIENDSGVPSLSSFTERLLILNTHISQRLKNVAVEPL